MDFIEELVISKNTNIYKKENTALFEINSQRQHHSDIINFSQKRWNNKDFDPLFGRNHDKSQIANEKLIQQCSFYNFTPNL